MKLFRRVLIWLLVLLAVAAAVALGWHRIETRETARAALQAGSGAPTIIELSDLDLVEVRALPLRAELPVSGTLKAVESVQVKAPLSGKLKDFTLREGDPVQVGALIARVDATEYSARLHQAEQQVEAARAQVVIAERQYANNKALADQGFISSTALENSAASLDSARAQLRSAQAGVQASRKTLQDTELHAPISGSIARRLAQPGEQVGPQTTVVEIVDLSALEVELALSPSDSVAVRIGQRARLAIEGVDEPVDARVARINPAVQAGSRSVLAYLSVQPHPGMRQGLFAQGVLQTDAQPTIAIPLSAVRNDQPTPYAQVVVQDDNGTHVEHRPVKVGAQSSMDGETVVGVTGLEAGELVLRAAAGTLAAGTRVRVVQSRTS